jgi:hypothetical protein
MRLKHPKQLIGMGLFFVIFLIDAATSWDTKLECTTGYKLWPIFTLAYFIIIRVVELQKIEELLVKKWLQILFFCGFFPSYLGDTILGFVLFF